MSYSISSARVFSPLALHRDSELCPQNFEVVLHLIRITMSSDKTPSKPPPQSNNQRGRPVKALDPLDPFDNAFKLASVVVLFLCCVF